MTFFFTTCATICPKWPINLSEYGLSAHNPKVNCFHTHRFSRNG
jgi:hypothetical protein